MERVLCRREKYQFISTISLQEKFVIIFWENYLKICTDKFVVKLSAENLWSAALAQLLASSG